MIIVYGSDECPRCNVIKQKIERAGIEYTFSTDTRFLEEKGFTQLPIVYLNDAYLTFKEMNQYLNNLEVEHEL